MNDDESKLKEEAKVLIAKTKKIIESLENQKDYKKSHQKNSSSTSPSRLSIIKQPQYDSPTFPPSRPSNTIALDKNLINTTLLDSKSDLKITVKNLSKRIAEMAIQIKQLENENKSKDEIILILQKKLYNSSNQISNLNQKIIEDRNNNVLVENGRLKRKIASLEKTLNDNTFMYEEIIKEYKSKINSVTNENQGNYSKLIEASKNKEKLMDRVEKMKNKMNFKDIQIKEMNETNYQSENREKEYMKKITILKDIIKKMVTFIKSLQKEEQQNYLLIGNLGNKLKEIIFKS